jgi:hypothetical protein
MAPEEVSEALLSGAEVELKFTAQEVVGVKAAKQQVGIRHGGLGAA